MSTKAQNIADSIKALKGGKTAAKPVVGKIDKIEKTGGRQVKPVGRNYVKKGGKGGTRRGSGRKPLEKDEKRITLKRSWEAFADEEEEVQVLHHGTKEVRVVKMKKVRVIQEAVYKAAKKGDMTAAKEFNDRVLGKSRQPIVGDEDESPIQVDHTMNNILDKAYGSDEEEE